MPHLHIIHFWTGDRLGRGDVGHAIGCRRFLPSQPSMSRILQHAIYRERCSIQSRCAVAKGVGLTSVGSIHRRGVLPRPPRGLRSVEALQRIWAHQTLAAQPPKRGTVCHVGAVICRWNTMPPRKVFGFDPGTPDVAACQRLAPSIDLKHQSVFALAGSLSNSTHRSLPDL